MATETDWAVGDIIHGFAGGAFGRDSYGCRRVEFVARDYVVARDLSSGRAEFAYRPIIDDFSFCEHAGVRGTEVGS